MIIISCTKEDSIVLGHDFEIDARLDIDSNGYYHLELGQDWQTLHRLSGTVSEVYNDFDLTRVEWESSHYWVIGDTLGYIVHQNWTLNDNQYLYMVNDTSYVTWFNGSEVPTINKVSYSTMDGEINTMFAPVQNMKGDTIQVTGTAYFADGIISEEKMIEIVIE
tara:strand:- start:624 stop:1115 length:492 start_codon:yes stop_codon:yes gene_type:complete